MPDRDSKSRDARVLSQMPPAVATTLKDYPKTFGEQ
jgi:hypothetical protein